MLAASRSLGIGIVVTLSLFIYFQEISFSHLRSAASTQSVDADNAAVLDIGKTIIDVAHKEGPRFRQATVVNVYDQKSSYERILKTHVDHGKKWGYPTHVLWQDNVGNGVNDEDVLNKTSYLQSILNVEMAKPVEERSQWIVSFDADTIILNQNIPWSIFLPPSDFKDINVVGTKDWRGFNDAVWLLRVNQWSVRMLTDAVALSPKTDLSGSNVGQEALKRVFNQSDYRKHVLYEPLDWFNGYDKPHGKPSRDTPPVTPGDLLVAFPEENGDRKFDVMSRWLARLGNEETFDALQIPLSKLTLSSRINDYWTRMRTAKGIVQEASDFEDKGYQDIKDPVVIENVESTRQKLLSAAQEVAFETETIQQGNKDLELALQMLHHGMQNDEHAFSSEAVGGTLELEAKGDKQQEVSQKDSHNAEESDLQERPKTQKGKTEQVEPVAQARQPKEPEKEGQEEAWHENQIARADGVAADEEEQEGDWHKIQVARAKEAAKKHG